MEINMLRQGQGIPLRMEKHVATINIKIGDMNLQIIEYTKHADENNGIRITETSGRKIISWYIKDCENIIRLDPNAPPGDGIQKIKMEENENGKDSSSTDDRKSEKGLAGGSGGNQENRHSDESGTRSGPVESNGNRDSGGATALCAGNCEDNPDRIENQPEKEVEPKDEISEISDHHKLKVAEHFVKKAVDYLTELPGGFATNIAARAHLNKALEFILAERLKIHDSNKKETTENED